MPTSSTDIVLGGGLSGLTAARALRDLGRDHLLLERDPTLGGLTRTVEVGDFCFDYTGHFLHLSHYASPANIPFAGLDDEDWRTVERRSVCYVAGALIPAPIQYHLGRLPKNELALCRQSYDERPPLSADQADNFRDYIVSGFGQYLADLFLIPQNEKTMATSLEGLSPDAVKRFFPAPDESRIRAGLSDVDQAATDYNSNFWYPRIGGIRALVDGMAAELDCVETSQEVVRLDLGKRELKTAAGQTYRWRSLFFSAPLRQLCQRTNSPSLASAAARLTHSSTVTFNIGLRSELPPMLEGIHWIYVPDPDLPFYRVGFYSEISMGTVSRGCSSMYVEVGVPGHEVNALDITSDLQPRVLAALQKLGWLDPADIVALVVHIIDCAYVHHTPARESVISGIIEELAAHQVYPIGRYGQWDYTSMEDSIRSALNTVAGIYE